ncbi:hypothetical protein MRX96_030971 [Rhipicephalus microplus]
MIAGACNVMSKSRAPGADHSGRRGSTAADRGLLSIQEERGPVSWRRNRRSSDGGERPSHDRVVPKPLSFPGAGALAHFSLARAFSRPATFSIGGPRYGRDTGTVGRCRLGARAPLRKALGCGAWPRNAPRGGATVAQRLSATPFSF